jgi:hypothetical protein
MTITEIKNRNWQKARLTGFCLDANVLSDRELFIYKELIRFKKMLLQDWDSEYETLLGHKLKPYKCKCCGRRSDNNYILEDVNYCYKHYNYFKSI